MAETHGLPLFGRMAVMGHSRPAMIMNYTMADSERRMSAMDVIMVGLIGNSMHVGH